MSEIQQAPPQSYDPIPVRPPSRPSRVPLYIWVGIGLFCLVMFGSALGLFLGTREAFSSKDLKKATSLKINFVLKGNVTKTLVVNDPAEVNRLLDALTITDTQMGPQSKNSGGTVEFTLGNGKVAVVQFMSQTQLNRDDWGWVYVTMEFYRAVNDTLSRTEGRKIDIMRNDN
jgi:hypothetical protein